MRRMLPLLVFGLTLHLPNDSIFRKHWPFLDIVAFDSSCDFYAIYFCCQVIDRLAFHPFALGQLRHVFELGFFIHFEIVDQLELGHRATWHFLSLVEARIVVIFLLFVEVHVIFSCAIRMGIFRLVMPAFKSYYKSIQIIIRSIIQVKCVT